MATVESRFCSHPDGSGNLALLIKSKAKTLFLESVAKGGEAAVPFRDRKLEKATDGEYELGLISGHKTATFVFTGGDNQKGYAVPSGKYDVKLRAYDEAGKVEQLGFSILVKDLTSQAPADHHIEIAEKSGQVMFDGRGEITYKGGKYVTLSQLVKQRDEAEKELFGRVSVVA